MSAAKLPAWLSILLVCLLFLGLLGGFTLGLHSLLGQNPPGADFFTFWVAGRALFTQGQDPYSAEVTLASQQGIYGRAALPEEDQVAYAYPPYALLPLLPVAFMPYSWAQAFWMAFNILLLLTVAFFSLPKAPRWLVISFLFFYPVAFGVLLGNFAVLIGAILIGVYCFVIDKDNPKPWVLFLAGFLLAWTTAKPQFMWLFLLFIGIYVLRYKRWWLVAGGAAGMLVMLGLSWLLVPNWLNEWITRIQEYAGYVQSQPTLMNFLLISAERSAALKATIITAVGCLIFTFWLMRAWWKKEIPSLQVLIWFGFVTYLFHPHGISYEQMCFLAPLLIWAGQPPRKTIAAYLAFWWVPLIISWVAFVISKWVFNPADEWPLIYFCVFVLWVFTRRTEKKEKELHADT
ncbi:MAG TPA: glycosyltransferase 87 family protein [Longilinea sp.]|nr:glycosyltransferase 87 family protein [Longilinea sp.]